MKKFILPKIHLSTKQIIVVSSTALVILLCIGGYLLWNHLNDKTEYNQKETVQENANDNEEARVSLLQQYTSKDTSIKFKVYAETVSVVDTKGKSLDDGTIPVVQMTQSCSYSDGIDSMETTYTIGMQPTEVNNHCLLTFKEMTAFMDDDEYLNAYIVLPDNSLIVFSTKDSPSIQVNIYANETRVVQLNGYAYYRIAKKDATHKFVTQIADTLLQVTGTEYYAQAQEDEESTLWGSFQLLEGSAKLVDRAGKFIYDMLVPEDYDYGVVNGFRWTDAGMWERDQFSYNKGLLYTFTSNDGISGEGDPKQAAVEGFTPPTNFLSTQVMMTLKKYGFGNFTNNTLGSLEAMVSEQIVDVQDLRRENISSELASLNEFWDTYNTTGEKENSTNLSGNSTGTSTNVCEHAGYIYAGNGKCCPSNTYLGTDNYCHEYGNSKTSSKGTPTYYYSDEEQCFSKDTASYQLFCGASNTGTIKNGRCCIGL